MREIGGYIELDNYHLPMLHEKAIALNCGRNCLAYILRSKKIKKLYLPYFLCDSVNNVCKKENVPVQYYHVGIDFLPEHLQVKTGEWVYLVNYYGQIQHQTIKKCADMYKNRVIVDNAQAYFDEPVEGIDTIYTCRKYFGVPDGGFLYTDEKLLLELEQDVSFERMHFLLGRYEQTAPKFYGEYVYNNQLFATEPIKTMSKLTTNLLHGIDYALVKQRRTDNYKYLFEHLKEVNRLELIEIDGAFAYPLWLRNGAEVRKRLQEIQIYIPTLWPNVLEDITKDSVEYDMAFNILPIPVDQRYDLNDMDYIVKEVLKCID